MTKSQNKPPAIRPAARSAGFQPADAAQPRPLGFGISSFGIFLGFGTERASAEMASPQAMAWSEAEGLSRPGARAAGGRDNISGFGISSIPRHKPVPTTSLSRPLSNRASIIIVVLVTLAFASMAMMVFMDKAFNDLLVEQREAAASRMRLEAYSAMETTIGTLEDFRSALGALRSPAEGWGDPLGFAGYESADADTLRYYGIDPRYTVEVAFEDESGKLSLPNINATKLTNLFTYWGLDADTSAKLTDALLGWMKKDYIPASAGAPQPEDYDTGDLPFAPPGRTLRSFDELASIDYVRDQFYDEDGRPNDLYRRFVAAFSLYDFQTTNINGVRTPDILGALGSQDPANDQKLIDFLDGADNHAPGGAPGWFATKGEISQLLGDSPATSLIVTISALRVIVTVREGQSSYRLNCLLSVPPGGAKIPAGWSQVRPASAVATSGTSGGGIGSVSNSALSTSANASSRSATGASQAAGLGGGTNSGNTAAAPVANLRYPYTFLEVRENDQIPPPAPSISSDTSGDTSGASFSASGTTR